MLRTPSPRPSPLRGGEGANRRRGCGFAIRYPDHTRLSKLLWHFAPLSPITLGPWKPQARGEPMRHLRLPLAAALLAAAAPVGSARPPIPFDDAAVHAVQFVD